MRQIKRHIKKVLAGLHDRLARLRRAIGQWWREHCQRMAGETDYSEAFTAVVLAAVELVTDSDRVRYLTHEVVAAYVAALRAFRPRYGDGWA